jgi:sensor histidine kinase YesM
MIKGSNFRHSLVYKASIRIAMIIAILLVVLVLSNVYSLNVVQKNALTSTRNTSYVYINNIENSLNSITKDLNEVSVKYADNIWSYPNMGELAKFMAATQLRDVFLTKLTSNENIDGLFIAQPGEDLFLAQFSMRMSSEEIMNLTDYYKGKKSLKEFDHYSNWYTVNIHKTNYLVKNYKISGMIIGAVIKTDTLMSPIKKTSLKSNDRYVLTDNGGKILSVSDASSFLGKYSSIPNREALNSNFNKSYYIITSDIPSFNGKLSSVIERKTIFYGLGLIQWIIIGLGIISVFIIPYVINYLFRGIIQPVKALVTATKEIESGNWDYRLPRKNTPLEFITLNNSFESMVREIKTLKIDSYEEKLERQKAELKYLQMQLKPHFYLNAITTISSLTYQNRNEDIREFINFLSRHLRYMFKAGLIKVTINEEIEHVKNYIKMQEIKFPDTIFYMTEIEPGISNYLIPQLLIQTFVENTFKHALTVGEMLSIFIKAEKHTQDSDNFVKIVIEDNGDGFSAEIIESVNSAENAIAATGEKIGIANIKKTLSLIYKREGLLKLSNCDPSGARVTILLPIEEEDKNESIISR